MGPCKVLVVGSGVERSDLSNEPGRTISALPSAAAAADRLWHEGHEVSQVMVDRALATDRDVVELASLCERDWPRISFTWFEGNEAVARRTR